MWLIFLLIDVKASLNINIILPFLFVILQCPGMSYGIGANKMRNKVPCAALYWFISNVFHRFSQHIKKRRHKKKTNVVKTLSLEGTGLPEELLFNLFLFGQSVFVAEMFLQKCFSCSFSWNVSAVAAPWSGPSPPKHTLDYFQVPVRFFKSNSDNIRTCDAPTIMVKLSRSFSNQGWLKPRASCRVPASGKQSMPVSVLVIHIFKLLLSLCVSWWL